MDYIYIPLGTVSPKNFIYVTFLYFNLYVYFPKNKEK